MTSYFRSIHEKTLNTIYAHTTMPASLQPLLDGGLKKGSSSFNDGTLKCHCKSNPVEVQLNGNVLHNHACGWYVPLLSKHIAMRLNSATAPSAGNPKVPSSASSPSSHVIRSP